MENMPGLNMSGPLDLYQRPLMHLAKRKANAPKRWSAEEDRKLIQAVRVYGEANWKAIGEW